MSKTALQSKKFIAFLVAEITWKLLAGMVLFFGRVDHETFIILLVIIVTAGTVEIGYILGQAALDKYIHLAEETFKNKG